MPRYDFDGLGFFTKFQTKLALMSWGFVGLVALALAIGVLILYSAGGGNFDPWAMKQLIRATTCLGIMICVSLLDVRLWLRTAYGLYFISLCLLVAVELFGKVGMGAQRWLHLGIIQIQPSEIMKLTLIMALARYYHGLDPDRIRFWRTLIIPGLLIGVPVLLVLKQPDLGTAIMLSAGGLGVMFLAGVRWRVFIMLIALVVITTPVAWQFLHDYQKERVLTFLDPGRDPSGAGYHIIQSKIALGSGGLTGKGYLEGTQSHLNFLPEKHTDFIFTTMAEEFGLLGSLFLIGLYLAIVVLANGLMLRCQHSFGRLLGIGVVLLFSLYAFINIAMVIGLIPVVGVPLPLISYGGTSMLSISIGFGMLLSIYIHRHLYLPRTAAQDGVWKVF